MVLYSKNRVFDNSPKRCSNCWVRFITITESTPYCSKASREEMFSSPSFSSAERIFLR